MKRWKTLGCLLLLCVVALTGCTRGGRSEPVVISMWHYYTGPQLDAFQAQVNSFNATVGKEQKITVVAHSMGSITDLGQHLRDSLEHKVGAEEVPDLFLAYTDQVLSLRQEGKLADLTQYFTEKELAELHPAYLQEGRLGQDAGLYIFPIAKSTEALYVNWTAWQMFQEETGADPAELATWEGIQRLAEQFYAWSAEEFNTQGYAFFGRDAYANYLLVGSEELGAGIFQRQEGQKKFHLDRDVLRRLWENFCVPYGEGYYTALGRYRSDDMKTGNLFAYVGSTSSVGFVPQQVTWAGGTTGAIEVRVFPIPSFADVAEPCAVQQGAGAALLKSDPEREQAAATFLKYITQPEQNVSLAMEGGYMPVTRTAVEEDNIRSALAKRNIAETSVQGQNQLISAQTLWDRKLVHMEAFDTASAARSLLESNLRNTTESLRTAYLQALKQGMTQAEAKEACLGDAAFAQWCNELEKALNAL